MKKYIVVELYFREMKIIGTFDSWEDAYYCMEERLKNTIIEVGEFSEEDLENDLGKGDVWGINELSAWYNEFSLDSDFDWQIFEVVG